MMVTAAEPGAAMAEAGMLAVRRVALTNVVGPYRERPRAGEELERAAPAYREVVDRQAGRATRAVVVVDPVLAGGAHGRPAEREVREVLREELALRAAGERHHGERDGGRRLAVRMADADR